MEYKKMIVKDGRLIEVSSKTINYQDLTSDCWMIQFEGLKACKTCEFRASPECGGGETLKKLKKGVNND